MIKREYTRKESKTRDGKQRSRKLVGYIQIIDILEREMIENRGRKSSIK